jgi:hypothetical protein
MSVLSEQNVQCETIQNALDTQFQVCAPVGDSMPFFEAVLATTPIISQSVSDNGKVKTVKVTYDQRALESAVTTTTGARTCTSTNETYNNYATYTIDPATFETYGEKIDVADFATVCQDFGSVFNKKVAKVIDVIERKVATKITNAVIPLVGSWGSNATAAGTITNDELVVATLVSAATKVLDYSAAGNIETGLALSGYCQSPIIVGGITLYNYYKYLDMGCCSETGVDIQAVANAHGKAVMFDKRLASALGSQSKSIVFQPGALGLITYNEYNETGLMRGANYDKFKVFSPRTGLPIDIVVKDDCGTISIIGYATAKLVGMPTDMFAVGDEYRSVNFVNKILVTNPA